MRLPFSQQQFLDVFGEYNRHLWPVSFLLWLAALFALEPIIRRGRPGRRTGALLAVLWAWSGIAYHWVFFSRINPLARVFAGLFLVQAIALAIVSMRRSLTFTLEKSPRHVAGVFLMLYAMAYPLLAVAEGHTYPRVPTFAVPCPTLLLTAGLLLCASPRAPRRLLVIPIFWAVVGGSAALLLGMRVDFMLLVAGVLLLALAVAPARTPARA